MTRDGDTDYNVPLDGDREDMRGWLLSIDRFLEIAYDGGPLTFNRPATFILTLLIAWPQFLGMISIG